VLVPVMLVGIMRVFVDETAMLVRMAVRFAVRIGRRVRVRMMRVVDMPVLMTERFVHMFVLVFFGKMQIQARRHEPGSADQGQCDGLAEPRNRDRSADKGRGRVTHWPLQPLDLQTASAFAGLLVAAGGGAVKFYKSRTAAVEGPLAPVVSITPSNAGNEPARVA
jgi:hypothetical protein